MHRLRALVLVLGTATGVHAAHPDQRSFLDSLLAVPYQSMVGDLSVSYHALHRALPIARQLNDPNAEGRLCGRLSVVHHLLNQLDSATHYGLLAVELHRTSGDRALLGEALCNLGHEVKRTDLQQAFEYYRQGLPILEATRSWQALAGCYDNYGAVQELGNDRDSALFFYRKALSLKEQLNDSNGIPYSLNKIAVALLPQQRYHEALALVQRADTIRRALGDRMGLADQAAYFGDVYQAWGRYTEAIEQFVLGIHRASEVSFPFLRQYCYERIAECQEALGDHRAALEATKRATQVRDSIQGENTARTILELKERYNAAEKDRAIALLNERAARRQLYIWAGLGAMVLLVLGGLWSHQHRQRRLRAERDAAIIREREAGLKAVIEATEEERRRLARELHDGVGQKLGGLKHRLEHLRGAPNAPGLQDTITIVDDTAREVRDLAHQLMPKTLSRLGLVPAVEDLLHKAFNATGTKVGLDHVGMEAGVPDSLATGLYRIVQELVGNIIKHAHATAVEVQLLRNKGHVVLIVQDNGRGLVRTEGAVGLGLMNIADRARAMGGTFSIEGGPGRGTVATIRVPLPQ